MVACERGYYNSTETYYNKKEAKELINGLKEGFLIVQIPCEKKKREILYSLYENETDASKKEEYKKDYDAFLLELEVAQIGLYNGVKSFYSFSDYAFIPDTLIGNFKKGRRDNIFLNDSLEVGKEINIDTSQMVLILRDHRDYDNLYIHKLNGSFPPSPFPYSTQLPLINKTKIDVFEMAKLKGSDRFFHAIYIMNQRLASFYNKANSTF